MNFPSKLAAILCFIQTFFIITGYLITCWSLRIWDKSWGENAPRIFDLDFVRTFGPWCLLVPLVWGIVAIVRARLDGGDTSITGLSFFIGLCLTVVVVCIFAFCTLHALFLPFSGTTRLS